MTILNLLFFLTLGAVCALIVRFLYYYPQQLVCLQHISSASPNTTIFAFDLHGVVFKQKKWSFIKKIGHFVRLHGYSIIGQRYFWQVLYRMFLKGSLIEYHYDALMQEYKALEQMKPYLIDMLADQHFDKTLLSMLRALKKRGFRLYVLSNIWQESLVKLRKKYPELDTLFVDYFIPQGNLGKPQPAFFVEFEKFIALREGSKQIIFIDNSENNVKGAQSVGILACDPHYLFLLRDSIP